MICTLGVGIAPDDFGTGPALLCCLRRFPLDYFKIDRRCISGDQRAEEDDAIIAASTSLSHTVNLSFVADGTETEVQSRRIRALGCDAMQGYLYGRPAALPQLAADPPQGQPDID